MENCYAIDPRCVLSDEVFIPPSPVQPKLRISRIRSVSEPTRSIVSQLKWWTRFYRKIEVANNYRLYAAILKSVKAVSSRE